LMRKRRPRGRGPAFPPQARRDAGHPSVRQLPFDRVEHLQRTVTILVVRGRFEMREVMRPRRSAETGPKAITGWARKRCFLRFARSGYSSAAAHTTRQGE
jgi:hypothetical protein